MIINKSILHVLDTNLGQPILSSELMKTTDETFDYLTKHIEKALNSPKNKEFILKRGNENCELLLNYNDDEFIAITQNLSKNIFKVISKSSNCKPCNLIFGTFMDNDILKMCMLKMDYKNSYIHSCHDNKNNLIQYRTTMPNISQKSDESFVYEVDTNTLLLNEKRYNIEEENTTIFSNYIFDLPFNLSPEDTINTIEKVSNKIVAEFYNNDIEKQIDIKKEIVEAYNENKELNINKIAENFNEDAQGIYTQTLKNKGIKNKVTLDSNLSKIINKKQKIRTEEGIEILIPVEYLDDKGKILIEKKSNGATDITLKNIINFKIS
jgi:hypothetical protein